ncbi:predicted protein [Lichtheimia corymbifera JMRC:FSU:9682]|uniref:Uncharacterized protein n=1 Tax=Lichtheimia corymbifera JMRC:FSU:9682 TaxID=1263082 RepID=A0A068RUJ0_9FUNG|nr:predicted protein [Lichtheimia corymbifera JMRC:FSU:9682]
MLLWLLGTSSAGRKDRIIWTRLRMMMDWNGIDERAFILDEGRLIAFDGIGMLESNHAAGAGIMDGIAYDGGTNEIPLTPYELRTPSSFGNCFFMISTS